MAKVTNLDYSLRQGKMNKDSKVVYRVRNGKQQSYTPNENTNPPSKAQNAYRKLFGKITSIVNAIMADPKQEALWEQRRIAYNKSVALDVTVKRYKTTRAYVFTVIREQLEHEQAAKRRRRPIPKALPRGLKFVCKHFGDLSTTELYEMLKARFTVFYSEQNCRYQDMDDIDYSAMHLAVFRKGKVIAYARLYQDAAHKEQWHIGRLLTIERGKGFGKYIMQQAQAEAQRLDASMLLIHAQTHAVPLYESLGYKSYGDIFMEAEMPHIAMKMALKV